MSDVAMELSLPRRVHSVLQSPLGWLALLVVLVGALMIGARTPGPTNDRARVAYLDSVIKCPSCTDVSIAQSNTTPAVRLRSLVATWVHEGWSNDRIERQVVSTYGEGEILSPTNRIIWIVPIVAVSVAAVDVVGYLYRRRSSKARDDDDLDTIRRHLGSETNS